MTMLNRLIICPDVLYYFSLSSCDISVLILFLIDVIATVQVNEQRSDICGVYCPFTYGLSELNIDVNPKT